MSDDSAGEPSPVIMRIGSYEVVVDKDMLPILNKYTWHVSPDKKAAYAYTNVRIGGRVVLVSMHRFLTGMSSSSVDHKNRNGLDNRLSNLRFATKQENSRNRIRKNSFGFRGVYQPKGCLKFGVQIQINGRKYHEYGFETVEAAACRYDELSKEHHGEFGIRNFEE